MRIRLRISSQFSCQWIPSLLSVVLHAGALTLIFVAAAAMRPDSPGWFDGQPQIQYISLKAPPAALIWTPAAKPAPPVGESPPKVVFTPSQPNRHPGPLRAEIQPPPRLEATPEFPVPLGEPAAMPAGIREMPPPLPPLSIPGFVLPASPEELRVLHPRDGHFAVVLARNSAPEDAPEDFQGRMTYTVYLDVGTPSPWMLHYSSGDPPVRISGNVVHIGAVERIEAPYPQITIVPSGGGGSGNSRLAVSGILDAAGHLQALRPAGDGGPESAARLIALLQRWSFRPAKKAGIPSAIAILLVAQY